MIYNQRNLDVAKFADKDGISPELESVYFTPTSTVATDRYKLLEVTTPKVSESDFPVNDSATTKPATESVLLKAKAVQEVKIPKNKDLPITENVQLANVTEKSADLITNNSETFDIKTIIKTDAEFPDYKQLIKECPKNPKVKVIVNAKYLKELAQYFEKFSTKGLVTLELNGENEPIKLEHSDNGQTATALLMPVKQ